MAAKDRWPELLNAVAEDDGLPTRPCGAWTEQKLYLWHRYLEITTSAMVGKPAWPEGLVYIDLFCGPGVCQVRETGKRLPGSPLIAANAAKPFRKLIFTDIDGVCADSTRERLERSPARGRYEVLTGDSNTVVQTFASRIPRGTLSLAFIDPEALDVHFSTLQTLAQDRAVDFLLLFADATDLVRNVDLYEQQDSKLDAMLGPDSGWRQDWAALKNRSGTNVRELFPKIYERQIQKHLNYVGLRREVVNGPHGPLYSLLYASKHERGLEFWDKIAKKELGGQTRMF